MKLTLKSSSNPKLMFCVNTLSGFGMSLMPERKGFNVVPEKASGFSSEIVYHCKNVDEVYAFCKGISIGRNGINLSLYRN